MPATTRRRMSSIDRLPKDALPALRDAFDRILEARESFDETWQRLNDALSKHDIDPISRSAFNRYSLHVRAGRRPRPAVEATSTSLDLEEALDRLETALKDVREALSKR